MRSILIPVILSCLHLGAHAAQITIEAAGQYFEGKNPVPSRTVAQGFVDLFDSGVREGTKASGDTVSRGSGFSRVYGTADDFTLVVDTASVVYEPLFLTERVWTLVSASLRIVDEWLEFEAFEPFTVEANFNDLVVARISGGGDNRDATNQNTFTMNETWDVYNAAGELQPELTWNGNFYRAQFFSGEENLQGEPFHRATFDLEPGWKLRRRAFVSVTARARALNWSDLFASSIRLSLTTKLSVIDGPAQLAATSTGSSYGGIRRMSPLPAIRHDSNGLITLKHPAEATGLVILESSPDLATWSPVEDAYPIGSGDNRYSIVRASVPGPLYYRFVAASEGN